LSSSLIRSTSPQTRVIFVLCLVRFFLGYMVSIPRIACPYLEELFLRARNSSATHVQRDSERLGEVFLRGQETYLGGDRMKNVTVAVVYLAFGVFFLFAGVSMLGISGTVQANYSANGAIDPVFVLTAGGLTVVAASFLFLVLTFRFFRGELFGE
jgi:hypothetical protein